MKVYYFMVNCFLFMKFKEKIFLFNYFLYFLYYDVEYIIIFLVFNLDIFLYFIEDIVVVGIDFVFFVELIKMLFFFCLNFGL